MQPKVSVIVPVYRPRQDFFDRLMDSIVRQTIGIEDLEVIIVSDGDNSTKTKKILSSWEQQYPENIMLVFYEENRRPGFARTLGIESAHGEYIAFADQDDWVSLEMYRVLYEKAKEYQSEVTGGYSTRDMEYQKPVAERNFTGQKDVFWEIQSERERRKFLREAKMGGYWCSIYDRNFLLDNNIYFPADITYDDNLFGMLIRYHATRVLVLGEYFYHWYVNDSSISMKLNSKTHFDRLHVEMLKLQECRTRGFFEPYRDIIERDFLQLFYFNTWHIFFHHLDYIPYETYLEMCRVIKEEFPDYRINPFIQSNNPGDNFCRFPLYPVLVEDAIEKNNQEYLESLEKIPEKIRRLTWLDTINGDLTEEDLLWFKKIYLSLPVSN